LQRAVDYGYVERNPMKVGDIDKHKVIVAITTLSRAHGTTFDPGNLHPAG
jgi:hypothetical protein